MNSITIEAPAKVNYLLDVIRRRPDGYHDLRMIMQRVNLCDSISISLQPEPGIRVTCDADGVPDGPDNIAWKAADALLKRSGRQTGVQIAITKRIPAAAGLGGGSSDAAAVLTGLNTLLQLDLTDPELMAIGVTLGADVPFFIFRKTALAEGIGEVLTPMPALPQVWVLLVNPGIAVSTAWVYKSLQLTNRDGLNKIPTSFGGIADIASLLSNDLERVTIPAFPVIDGIKRAMMYNGAAGAMMSGSGPTVFGIFAEQDTAEHARQIVTAGTGWFSAVAETL